MSIYDESRGMFCYGCGKPLSHYEQGECIDCEAEDLYGADDVVYPTGTSEPEYEELYG